VGGDRAVQRAKQHAGRLHAERPAGDRREAEAGVEAHGDEASAGASARGELSVAITSSASLRRTDPSICPQAKALGLEERDDRQRQATGGAVTSEFAMKNAEGERVAH
jgi:hypothetical protein